MTSSRLVFIEFSSRELGRGAEEMVSERGYRAVNKACGRRIVSNALANTAKVQGNTTAQTFVIDYGWQWHSSGPNLDDRE